MMFFDPSYAPFAAGESGGGADGKWPGPPRSAGSSGSAELSCRLA